MQNTPFASQQQQVNKFLEANRRVGAMMDSQQGTTRVIYDTTGNTTTPFASYEFFSFVNSKTFPATNLENNRFQPGEGMVIKEIMLLDTTINYSFTNNSLAYSVIDFFVGNNRVLKALPLACFGSFAAINNINAVPGADTQPTAIRLLTNIVIPPQIEFKAVLRMPQNIGSVANPANLKLSVKGYGKLFNPRNNY